MQTSVWPCSGFKTITETTKRKALHHFLTWISYQVIFCWSHLQFSSISKCMFSIPVHSSPCRLYRHSPPLGCNHSNLVYPACTTHVKFRLSGCIWNCPKYGQERRFYAYAALQSLDFLALTRHVSTQWTLLLQLLSLQLTMFSLIVKEHLATTRCSRTMRENIVRWRRSSWSSSVLWGDPCLL